MARTIKLYKVPESPTIPGIRPMRDADVPTVTKLLCEYLETNYKLAPCMTEDEVRHWMVMQDEVIYSYVIENDKGDVTDLI